MERWLPEVIAAGDLEGLGLEPGEVLDRLLDGGLDAVLGAEVGERFAKDAITKPVKPLNFPPKPKVGHHLSRDGAD